MNRYQNTTRLCLAFLFVLTLGAKLLAQQFVFTQDLSFQAITSLPANAGKFTLYPYGPHHFVTRASELVDPIDFAVYDSLGHPTGLHFQFFPSSPAASARHFSADADGNVFIAGQYADSALYALHKRRNAVAKFLPDGSPDASWGLNGVWHADTSNGLYGFHALRVLPSGAVMLARNRRGSSQTYLVELLRLTPDGRIDTSYGSQGSALVNPNNTLAGAFFFADDGSTYACTNISTNANSMMARWRADGSLDSSFTIPGALNQVMSVLTDGRIVSYGYVDGTPGTFRLRRHWSDGREDSSFVAPFVPGNGFNCRLPGGGTLFFIPRQYNATTPHEHFVAILPDGTLNPTYMPDSLQMVFDPPPGFDPPAATCHPQAERAFWDMLMIGPKRVIYSDYLHATVPIGTSQSEFEYYYCPRVVSLVTDLQTVGQPEPAEASSLTLWPNPVGDHFSLRIPTRAKAAQVQLYDMTGKALAWPAATVTVVEGGLQYAYQDLGDLPSGLYLLRVTAAGQTFTAKFLKE